MRLTIAVLLVLACACAKKKSEDKSAAPPAAEQAAPAELPKAEGTPGTADPTAMPDPAGGTNAKMPSDDGGEATPRARMPSDDGGEVKKPMPSDDGGEATKKACTKTPECGANHDCCNGFCFKQGTAQHAIECKLPAGKL